MTCPLGIMCLAPRCKGRRWIAKSTAPADYRAYCSDLAEWLRARGWKFTCERATRFYKEAMEKPCLLN